jgi:formylglycine-generating enzyme required for sulfatase activity/tRNA A-37 threonylcarbamoyl transferase component Bud32
MPALRCPSCRRLLRIAEAEAGRSLPCPHCARVLTVRRRLPTSLAPSASAVPTGPSGVTLGGEDASPPRLTFLAPAQQADELGRLGGYRLLRVLGHGGMGLVFEAEDVLLRRRVALKVMLPEVAKQPQARERFLREARAAATLSHDHIISIYHVGEDNGVPFLVMPLLKGESLERRLRHEGRLPIAEVLRLGAEMAEGLAAAHARGLIHRDVKPANVWLETPGGRVKLLDFGLARLGTAVDRLTRTGGVLGTPMYMAPEQTSGQAEPGSDVFGLGVVLYELLAGQRPFDGPDLIAILGRILSSEPAPLRQLRPEVPPELAALVRRMLARTPRQRPTMAEVSSALRALRPGPGGAIGVGDAAGRGGGTGGFRWWGVLPVAAALLALVLAAVPLLWPKTPPDTRRAEEPPAKEAVVQEDDRERAEKERQRLQAERQKQEEAAKLRQLLAEGDSALDARRFAEARKAYEAALQRAPGNEAALKGLVEARAGAEDEKKRQAEYERLLADGRAAMSERHYKAAEVAFAAALRQKPGDPAALKALEEARDVQATPLDEIENGIGLKLKLIPAGKFLMGSPQTEVGRNADEGPQREVQISRPFYLGISPVTQAQYRDVMGENPSWFALTGGGKDAVAGLNTDRFPVESVSWHDAVAFCDKLSGRPPERAAGRVYRLPTEAEWEYACRAGTSTPFWWGDRASSLQANFDGNYPYGGAEKGPYLNRPCPVGYYKANPWGLQDMHGNVWQWCADWYGKDYYQEGVNKDPQGPENDGIRVRRGGSWYSSGRGCRAACRYSNIPGLRYLDVGFRVVCGFPPRAP